MFSVLILIATVASQCLDSPFVSTFSAAATSSVQAINSDGILLVAGKASQAFAYTVDLNTCSLLSTATYTFTETSSINAVSFSQDN
jgi:hypothetical protein